MKKALLAAVAAFHAVPALAGDLPVTIRFAAEIGGQPFSCAATYAGLGATATEVTGADFRLFVSEAAMIRADGSLQPVALDQDGQWQLDGLALIDFEDASGACVNGTPGTHTALTGSVPEGEYTGVAFTVGVPFEQNHVDPTLAAAPLNTTAMFWNWHGGYKFVRIDMVPTDRAADGPKGWFLHLGATVCDAASKTSAPTACANANRLAIRFDGFDAATNSVVVDPAAVVAGADLRANAPETSPGYMSFPNDADCMTVMSRLGLPYMEVPAGPQMLVSAGW